jgi:V/A-type H+-transporting ATPase subunit C
LTQTVRYASVLAKIGAERSNLFGDAKIKTLTDSDSLQDFAGQLRDSPYQEQLSKIAPPLTGRKLERALNENLIGMYKKIIKYSPKNAKDYLGMYLLRFEVENIKLLVKGTLAKLAPEEKLAKLYPFVPGHVHKYVMLEEAAKASSLAQLVHVFQKTPYWAPLQSGLVSYNQTGSTTCIDVFLDSFFYEHFYQVYGKLSRREKPHAQTYAATENDGYILISLLRGKNLNYDQNWLRLALPHSYLQLSSQTVDAMISAPTFEAAYKLALQTPYARYLQKQETAEETLSLAERKLKETRLQTAKDSTITNFFNIGTPLAFLTLKEAEVYNLRAIALGIDGALNADLIAEQLL